MHASTGIYWHLYVDAFQVYAYRCFATCCSLSGSIYIYMLLQARAGDLSVFHPPQLLLRIPSASRCLGLRPCRHVVDLYAQGARSGRRASRRDPCAPLPGSEYQPCFHSESISKPAQQRKEKRRVFSGDGSATECFGRKSILRRYIPAPGTWRRAPRRSSCRPRCPHRGRRRPWRSRRGCTSSPRG